MGNRMLDLQAAIAEAQQRRQMQQDAYQEPAWYFPTPGGTTQGRLIPPWQQVPATDNQRFNEQQTRELRRILGF